MDKPALIWIFIFSVLPILNSNAQNISGKIVDSKNQPVIGSSVFIKETSQGLICNAQGEFQASLNNGNYTLTIRCLGYKPQTKQIAVENKTDRQNITITLEEEPLLLKEVIISNKEDPAYEIMRKTIAKAPYYLNYIQKYTADVYMKSNMILEKVPKLIDKASSSEGTKLSDYKGQTFVMESFSEIQYTAPDNYKQTVKAFSNTIPDNINPENSMRLTRSSIYSPKFNGIISPLNKDAFNYYRFRYEGFSEENGKVINKIKFTAKVNDPLLTNGYLYIADNTFHISYAEIEQDIFGIKQHIIITYNEIIENVFLPITYAGNAKISTFGLKGEVFSLTSIKYNDIEVNNNVEQYLTDLKNAKRNFEIKTDTLYKTISDSLATKRDSAYWTQVRSLPLNEKEIVSYIRKDSMKQHIDSLKHRYHKPGFSIKDLIFGGRIKSDTARFYMEYDGLLLAVPEYNFVDGAWVGQKISLNWKVRKHNRLKVSPYAYYTYGRNAMIYGADTQLEYAPLSRGKLSLAGGSTTEDFNPLGITRFDNAIASAMYRESDNYFYKKDFIATKNQIDLTNGLKLTTGIEIAKRHGLTNHANWGIWGNPNKIKPNIRSDERFDLTQFSVELSYAPYAYYSIKDGRKAYRKITSPIFSVEYTEGFSGWQVNNSRFRKLQATISQNIELGFFNRISYQINGGSFIGNTDKLHFADYQHFNASNMFSVCKTPFETHMLLDNYRASTNKYWIRSQLDYQSNYILIKRLPFLQGIPFTENIHLKNLHTPDLKLYTEVGYSLDLVGFLNIGVFTSFDKTKYENFGVRLCYNLRKLITGK